MQEANVIVLNNVFDWFAPIDVQISLWKLIRQNVKSGSILVTVPSLESSLEVLPENAGIDLDTWVTPAAPFNKGCLSPEEREDTIERIFMYFVQ